MRVLRVFAAALAVMTLVASTSVVAQVKSTVTSETNERWWGGYTALGAMLPLLQPTDEYNFARQNLGNQAMPFFVSNYGRYIYIDEPVKWRYDGRIFHFDAPTVSVTALKVGKNLREAFVLAVNKHIKPSGEMPPAPFFEAPQFNTWIEMTYNQNQADIEAYAKAIIDNGFKPGVLMIDDNWQRHYGSFDFRAEEFSDPKAMVDKLHNWGFKVMLWVCPFVSPDSPTYRELSKKGYLIKDESGNPIITKWWNGHSAQVDLLNADALVWFESGLKELQSKYGVDGFKFDAGDFEYYEVATSNKQATAWQTLANKFEYSELRAAWRGGAQRTVQRLADKSYSWEALGKLIPEMLAASMLGYPYTCPDMIGGGEYSSFEGVTAENFNQELMVRWAQASALMPMMQFSVAPWRVLSPENLAHVKKAAGLHTEIAPYIMALAKESAKTGEPILRPIEYNYPKQGFADCNDQFLIGTKFLVAPILSSDGKRVVRLPRGVWTDDTGKRFRGPIVMEIKAELGRIPYYVHK